MNFTIERKDLGLRSKVTLSSPLCYTDVIGAMISLSALAC